MTTHTTFDVLIRPFLLLVLLAWGPLTAAGAKDSEKPCWIESPVSQAGVGQIGLAHPISMGSRSPAQISQLRALAALCASEGIPCDHETLDQALDAKKLGGQRVYFANYKDRDRVYGYAGFVRASSTACAPSRCDISACDPAWLCTPSTKNQTGLLGVSYRATSAQAQYDAAVRNALRQAEYLYGVDVAARKQLKTVAGGIGHYSLFYSQGEVDTGERERLAYHMAHQCQSQSTLFTHIVIDKAFDNIADIPADDPSWIQNPKYKGIDGAVGVVEKLTASGLMSEQIKLAIKRAAIQLAFEKYSVVSAHADVRFGNQGQVFISIVKEKTDIELKAQLIKIHFEQTPGKSIKVFAWLAILA